MSRRNSNPPVPPGGNDDHLTPHTIPAPMSSSASTLSVRSGDLQEDYTKFAIPTPRYEDDSAKSSKDSLPQDLPIQPTAHPTGDNQLGITWTNLTVKGIMPGATINENVFSQFNSYQKFKESRGPKPLKTIIDDSHGCVKPGEMLLVVGRPGAGCTTLLNMLANRRSGYAEVEGDVYYGSMHHKEAKQYPGQIVMNTEEEVFFPTLTVQQTMDFATTMKMPFQSTEEQRVHERDEILGALNISHTKSTKVGNEFVRGVSGGERKRVSIAEILATRASVYCWDNPTRGLDASTALEFTRHLRHLTDTMGLTNIVTLYQPGNGIYNEFDKVLVLDQGKQIYYGPRAEALPFMQKLGFFCDPSANVADFLSGLTVPTERQILPGFEDRFPRTADEILAAYLASSIKAEMEKEYSYPTSEDARSKTKRFQEHVRAEKHKSLPDSSTLTSSPVTQIMGTVRRQVQILWGDKPTFMIKNISTIIQALINGSVFYNAADDSTGLFLKGGALFLSLLYPSLLAMSETTDSFVARPVLAKHRMMAYHDPAAFCLAQILIDIPVSLLIVTPFSVIIYFMVGLRTEADAFFTYWFMLFSATMTMTVFFRFCGAAFSDFQSASKISGFAVSAIATYVGYMIPKPDMHPWFVWIYWINPLAYGFESLLSNEFHGRTIQCAGNNLIPLGPSYRDKGFQACSGVRGVTPGASSFTGDQYLQSLAYSHSHMWRNFGIMWAWWALFAFLTIYFTRGWKQTADGSRSLLLPRENVKKVQAQKIADEENAAAGVAGHANAGSGPNADSEKGLIRNTSVFTWKNLSYTVPTPEGERTLLHNVNGWVKPGQLGALMGSSGAGKTTLMDVLAQRKTSGTIHGSIQVDGRPLPVSFQRSAGYCEQLDVHERMATVREALEFAALLRQSRDTPKEEKIKYVDTIVDLLELQDIENTLIGSPGNGLSIEQRKRVTIAVELVSKPDILIFLDEPTSGLDGQAAFSTVRFLRKLADVGQAVLVTIHQPSASLFAQFDTLLLLQKGGKTAYFGEIGEKAATLKEYFGRYGAPCPPEANPAEHMIDVVSGRLSGGQDWHEVWLSSPECEKSLQELDRIIADAAAKPPGSKDDGHEFAAPIGEQIRILSRRMNIALFRDIEYVNNRVALHIGSALFNGFTFWMVKDHVADLQLRLFAVFNFIFVAPGVFAQLQPLFLERRDIYETREKKSKTYHWSAFVTALIISEIPYLLFCGLLYWACFYYTVGFPTDSNKAGATLFVMLVYELLYTGMGQFIAAYAPNAVFASLVNPVVVGVLVTFCGVLVPYQALTAFWRYWLYYLDPLTYIMSAMLVFTTYDAKVVCSPSEMAIFNTPGNVTCGEYLADYRSGIGAATMLMNPDATSGCQVCQYRRGSDYLYTLNIKEYLYGWRDSAIGCLFVLSSYGLVYLLMKLRTKATKKAED